MSSSVSGPGQRLPVTTRLSGTTQLSWTSRRRPSSVYLVKGVTLWLSGDAADPRWRSQRYWRGAKPISYPACPAADCTRLKIYVVVSCYLVMLSCQLWRKFPASLLLLPPGRTFIRWCIRWRSQLSALCSKVWYFQLFISSISQSWWTTKDPDPQSLRVERLRNWSGLVAGWSGLVFNG